MLNDAYFGSQQAFLENLQRCKELKNQGKGEEAADIIRDSLGHIVKIGPKAFWRLTPVELDALLIQNFSTVWVALRKSMLIAWMKEAGDYARWRDPEQGPHWYLGALRLLLDVLARQEHATLPEGCLPNVEDLTKHLNDTLIPSEMRLSLALYYERSYCYRQAVEQLRRAMAAEPKNEGLKQLAAVTIQRILQVNEGELVAAGLTRAELTKRLQDLHRTP
jgi:hypothetical protein